MHASIPTLYDAVERFRNNIRLSRATAKPTAHTAFATLQGEPPSEPSAEEPQGEPSTPKPRLPCVFGESHALSMCPYLNTQRRPKEWTPDEQIQKRIDEKLASNYKLRKTVEYKQRIARQYQKKPKQPSELQGGAAEPQIEPSAPIASFAVDQDSYELRDT